MTDNINWPTVIISFSSSIAVSLFTFIIGLRSGKNQNDRQRLKQIYKDLYIYLESLHDGIKENNPITWNNFKIEWKNKDHRYYQTPLKEKENKGELVELDESKISKIRKNEIEYLQYGNEFINNVIPIINEKIFDELNNKYVLEKFRNNPQNSSEYFIEKKHKDTYSSIEISANHFFDDKSIISFSKIKAEENLYLSFKIIMKDKYMNVHIETLLFENLNAFLMDIYRIVDNIDYIKEMKSKKVQILRKCNNDLKFLKRRVKEPHTVINTLVNSFSDIFRQ